MHHGINRIDYINARKFQKLLKSYGVKIKILKVVSGIGITRYEFIPDRGTRIAEVLELIDDIVFHYGGNKIRLEKPTAEKPFIAIEIKDGDTRVRLADLWSSHEYEQATAPDTFILGSAIDRSVVVSDFDHMSSIAISGQTGTGKTVFMNCLMASIMKDSSPEETRFVIIDSKIVEYDSYNKASHLLMPVITKPDEGVAALLALQSEIEGREEQIRKGIKLPRIVVIVDEYADLMMLYPEETENALIRLLQLGHGAKINLVLSSQMTFHPSLIDVNARYKIEFANPSDKELQNNLSGAGALTGNGDMLFRCGYSDPIRLQGAFVSEHEIEELVKESIKKYGEVQYDTQLMHEIKNAAELREN